MTARPAFANLGSRAGHFADEDYFSALIDQADAVAECEERELAKAADDLWCAALAGDRRAWDRIENAAFTVDPHKISDLMFCIARSSGTDRVEAAGDLMRFMEDAARWAIEMDPPKRWA